MANILEKINQASMNFLVPLTVEETYLNVIKEAIKLINGYYGSLILEQDGELKRVYSTLPPLIKVKIREEGFTYKAFSERKILVNRESSLWKVHPEFRKLDIKTNIFIPLAYRKKSIGALIVNSKRKHNFKKENLHALELFGSMASLAIRKAQLHESTQKALEARDLFFSMAAHELRTPITTVYGYAQILNNKMGSADSVEARWIHQLYTESYRLTLLVSDLLEINRIRTGQLQYIWKECSIQELMNRVIKNFQLNYPQRVIIFENNLGKKNDIIVGDFDRLLQVLLNLLDNSAKFSLADQPIILSVEFKAPSFTISIKDHGHGILKNDLPKVFDRFYCGGNHQIEGMGLGLFLAKSIIEKHRGSIQVQSRLNKGTTIRLRLPKTKL